MERIQDPKNEYRTLDNVLDEELRNPEVATGYLKLAIPDGPEMIVDRIHALIRAGTDFSRIDGNVVDRVNESLAAAHLPIYWSKAPRTVKTPAAPKPRRAPAKRTRRVAA